MADSAHSVQLKGRSVSQEWFSRVAEALVAESVIEMGDEAGQLVEVWTIGNVAACAAALPVCVSASACCSAVAS
jgi:predicted TIM-barrel enzyme